MTTKLAIFVLVTINAALALAQRCDRNNPCSGDACCSRWGWCGCGADYCGDGCQSQCNSCRSPAPPSPSGGGGIGINYGRVANNLPDPSRVVNLVKSLPGVRVNRVKIFDPASNVLRAFANSGLRLTVAVPNQDIGSLGRGGQGAADDWLRRNIAPYYPAAAVEYIAMGNEVLSDRSLPWPQLVPAMWNLRRALDARGWRDIKVVTPLAMDVIGTSFPPSAGSFRSDSGIGQVMPHLLNFLGSTSSVFMINVYPFFSWQGNQRDISLDYALFRSDRPVVTDQGRGYTNLFDAMVDAVYSALERSGYPKLGLAIGETGWPSAGAAGATVENARAYNSGLARRVSRNVGTPKRPGALTTFIFALFNENQKGGPEVERHWGLLYPNGSPVYRLGLASEVLQNGIALLQSNASAAA